MQGLKGAQLTAINKTKRLKGCTIAALLVIGVASAQGSEGFRAIPLLDDSERVTDIYCASAKACVISTDKLTHGDPSFIHHKATYVVVVGHSQGRRKERHTYQLSQD